MASLDVRDLVCPCCGGPMLEGGTPGAMGQHTKLWWKTQKGLWFLCPKRSVMGVGNESRCGWFSAKTFRFHLRSLWQVAG